jgi:hypothetical protein
MSDDYVTRKITIQRKTEVNKKRFSPTNHLVENPYCFEEFTDQQMKKPSINICLSGEEKS